MAGVDPADYFARLGIDDNIFKRVTAKYQQKSIQWTMADAQLAPGTRAPASSPALPPAKAQKR
jgi:hypothetical protein